MMILVDAFPLISADVNPVRLYGIVKEWGIRVTTSYNSINLTCITSHIGERVEAGSSGRNEVAGPGSHCAHRSVPRP